MASGLFLTSNRFESVKNSIGPPNPSIHHGSHEKTTHRKSFLKKHHENGHFRVSFFSHTYHNCRKYSKERQNSHFVNLESGKF